MDDRVVEETAPPVFIDTASIVKELQEIKTALGRLQRDVEDVRRIARDNRSPIYKRV